MASIDKSTALKIRLLQMKISQKQLHELLQQKGCNVSYGELRQFFHNNFSSPKGMDTYFDCIELISHIEKTNTTK